VNGRRSDVPSMILYEGDQIMVREGSSKLTYFKEVGDLAEKRTSPSWLSRDVKQMSGTVARLPERAEIDGSLDEQLIVEYYSRR
jgi:small subunit ribosomal protein S4